MISKHQTAIPIVCIQVLEGRLCIYFQCVVSRRLVLFLSVFLASQPNKLLFFILYKPLFGYEVDQQKPSLVKFTVTFDSFGVLGSTYSKIHNHAHPYTCPPECTFLSPSLTCRMYELLSLASNTK